MTREEAIEKLHWFALDNRDKQIIDMAIEALTSQNPTTPNNTCEVDLISRADAIELCAEAQGRASTKSELKGISKVWQGLLKLPSAESEWIPCSERLPKAEDMYQPPEQRYLCQLEAHGERKFCVLSRLKGAASPFWDWYGIAVYDSEVTAWMPLPKPYREDGEE